MGIPAYKSIAEVGKPVDLAQLVLPSHVVPKVLEECGRAGVRRAIIISGGFKELPGAEGKEREREIKEIAAKYGIRLSRRSCVPVWMRSPGP